MFKFLVVLSVISAVIGLFLLPGTTGVGLVALGCYLLIAARLVQTEDHRSRTASTEERSPRNVSRREEALTEGPHSKSDRWPWVVVALFFAVFLGAIWFTEKQHVRPTSRRTDYTAPTPRAITPAARDTYTGQITQTGVGAGSGMFYIVLDDFVQCYFKDQDLPGEKRKMQQFQNSSALRLTVSGAPAPDHTPLLGDIRYDACRIEGWE